MKKKKVLFLAIMFVLVLSILSATVVSACVEPPPDPCIGNPGNDKCVGKSGEKDASFVPDPGTRGRSDGP